MGKRTGSRPTEPRTEEEIGRRAAQRVIHKLAPGLAVIVRSAWRSGLQSGQHLASRRLDRRRAIRAAALLLALTFLLIVACAATWQISWQRGIASLRERAAQRTERVNVNLKSTLDRFALLPYLISTHPSVTTLLATAPDTAARSDAVARANSFLARVNGEASANAAYVIDTHGVCLAASNWQQPISFVGLQYQFRPYFNDALSGRTGRFFGIGTSNAEPGYYVAQPVRLPPANGITAASDDRPVIGVVAVKLDLEWFEQSDSQEPMIATDEHGVIFLSTEAAWKYHTLAPLAETVRQAIQASRQYAREPLPALPLTVDRVLGPDAMLVRIAPVVDALPGSATAAGESAAGVSAPAGTSGGSGMPGSLGIIPKAHRYLLSTSQLAEPHWQLTTFTSLDPVIANANDATAITAFSVICLCLLGFYLNARRARVRDMIRSGSLLRAAYAELNRRVEERTADLSAANAQLHTEVAERTRAEQELRAAHRELVQASKLAALGQMAAGITHELNQPLAALRTFSDNTLILLERGHQEAARDNLGAIASLTDRMGRITNQLKLFVSQSRPQDATAPICRSIANALLLLSTRLQHATVRIWYDPVCRLDGTPAPALASGLRRLNLGVRDVRSLQGDMTAAGAPLATTGIDANTGAEGGPKSEAPLQWHARCDQLRLEQLLINVIGNAADALRDQVAATIDIVVSITSSQLRVAVQDNGPGIPDEHLPHLFEPFYTTKDHGEGMGLGLAISAAIASENGGTLRASNRVPTDGPDACAGAGPEHAQVHGAIFMLTLQRVVDASPE